MARTTSRGFGSGLRQAILNVHGLSTRARRTASIYRSWIKLSIRIISDTGWPWREEKANMKPFKIKISYAESSDTGYIR